MSIAMTVTLLLLMVRARTLAESGASPEPSQSQGRAATHAEAFLQETLNRCDMLDGYQIVFTSRERRGMFRTLGDWDRAQVDYRKNPKAIKMSWLNSDSDYSQAVYMEGRNEDKLKLLPRRGMFGRTPRPFSVNTTTPVSYGKALRPITDMGLAELIRITFKEMQQARQIGTVRVEYAGRSYPPDLKEPADRVIIHYPAGYADATQQDIYISTQTGYPIATYFWQSNGDLLATYLYGQPVPAVPPISRFQLSQGSTRSG